MIEFLFTTLVVLIAFGGMAIGILAGRGPIKGGCGRGENACDGPCARRCKHRGRGGKA
ncbi:MAG: hypothetical protein PVH86_07250 [Thiogranum sp.]